MTNTWKNTKNATGPRTKQDPLARSDIDYTDSNEYRPVNEKHGERFKNPLVGTRGRGTETNRSGRFNRDAHEVDLGNFGHVDEEDFSNTRTQFFKDTSRSIITENDSPDIPFKYSMNFYRGCEHGCVYCYARPTHEYLGLSAGLDFESKIYVKEEAPELLRERLMSPRWVPEVIVMSGVTDCYQPAERHYQLTRKSLEVLTEFGNPAALITKNALITRDIDIFKRMAAQNLVSTCLTITTLDPELARILEPRTSAPLARLAAIRKLADAGIPVSVNVAPVIPGLTDHEVPSILKAAAEAGADSAGYTLLRLPHSVSDLFIEWLDRHRPEAKEKILGQMRGMRGGELYNADFKSRMKGEGPHAENLRRLFKLFAEKYRLTGRSFALTTEHFRRPGDQLSLF